MSIEFWEDRSRKIIKPDLFSSVAESVAKEIAKVSNDRMNTPTQIRKFYDEVLNLKGIVRDQNYEFNKILPYVKMLHAKSAYSFERGLVSKEFKEFISTIVNNVNSNDDFEVMVSFFEAFMGFYKYEYEVKKIERKNSYQGNRR